LNNTVNRQQTWDRMLLKRREHSSAPMRIMGAQKVTATKRYGSTGLVGWMGCVRLGFDWFQSINQRYKAAILCPNKGGGVVLRGPQFSINYTCENFKDFFKNENFISVFWDKFCLSCFIIFFFELGFLKKETRKTAHCVPLAPLNSNKMIKKNFEKFQKNYP